MSEGEVVLAARGLTKRYGRRNVVDGVDMTVRRGDIYGFLGPNGAGKTTTLRMLVGLVAPTAGEVTLFGRDGSRSPRSLLRRVGALIEGPGLYPHLSARENLRLLQRLKRSEGGAAEVDEILEQVGLREAGNLPAGRFSQGMKQRLAIGMALVGRPELLVLDEPTNGLDPEGFRDMRTLLRELVQRRGMTVLLSSHLLHEVEQVATRVGVIRGGKMLVEASVDELRNRAARRIEVAVSDPQRAAHLLRDRFGWPVSALEDGTLLVHGAADPSRIAQAVVGESIRLRRLVEREPSLEDVFFALSEGGSR